MEGLSGFKIDKLNELEKHCEAILDTIMNTVGDDFQSDQVNFSALVALEKLISVMPIGLVSSRMTCIVNKISPFFDNSKHRRDASAAMKVFGQLANVFINVSDTIFSDLVHSVIVSILLHINDTEEEGREASKQTLSCVFRFFQQENLTQMASNLKLKRFNYSDFLKELALVEFFSEYHLSYIEKALNYFVHSDARLRSNAIVFITSFLMEGQANCQVDAEKICSAMSKLLLDSNIDVRISAASNMGKICIALANPAPKPRLSLTKS